MHAHATSAPFLASSCMYTMTCPSEEAAAAMGSIGWADRWRTAEPAAPRNRQLTTEFSLTIHFCTQPLILRPHYLHRHSPPGASSPMSVRTLLCNLFRDLRPFYDRSNESVQKTEGAMLMMMMMWGWKPYRSFPACSPPWRQLSHSRGRQSHRGSPACRGGPHRMLTWHCGDRWRQVARRAL